MKMTPVVNTLGEAIEFYLLDCKSRDMSPATLVTKRRSLNRFNNWCQSHGLLDPDEVSLDVMEAYRMYLHEYRKARDGEPLSANSKYKFLVDLKLCLRRLHRRRIIERADFEEFELPKSKKVIVRNVPSHDEVEQILRQPLLRDNELGLMDRTIMELLYACAIRRSEVVRIKLSDIDLNKRILLIINGKGMRDRKLPILERACHWIRLYLNEVRPRFLGLGSGDYLFLSPSGLPCSADQIGQRVGKYIRRSGVPIEGACHVFRHAVATSMLDNGADIRHVQKLLGHADISTTQIYTHVGIKKLEEVYNRTHPAL